MSATTDGITKTPGVCGGDACIRGHRIPVWVLVEARRLGTTDARLLEAYPSLSLKDLQAAWEYAGANAPEIERDIWENQAVMDEGGGDRRLALIVRGWQLGLSDAAVADAFSPPPSWTPSGATTSSARMPSTPPWPGSCPKNCGRG